MGNEWHNVATVDGGYDEDTEVMAIPGAGVILRWAAWGDVASASMVYIEGAAIFLDKRGHATVVKGDPPFPSIHKAEPGGLYRMEEE